MLAERHIIPASGSAAARPHAACTCGEDAGPHLLTELSHQRRFLRRRAKIPATTRRAGRPHINHPFIIRDPFAHIHDLLSASQAIHRVRPSVVAGYEHEWRGRMIDSSASCAEARPEAHQRELAITPVPAASGASSSSTRTGRGSDGCGCRPARRCSEPCPVAPVQREADVNVRSAGSASSGLL